MLTESILWHKASWFSLCVCWGVCDGGGGRLFIFSGGDGMFSTGPDNWCNFCFFNGECWRLLNWGKLDAFEFKGDDTCSNKRALFGMGSSSLTRLKPRKLKVSTTKTVGLLSARNYSYCYSPPLFVLRFVLTLQHCCW